MAHLTDMEELVSSIKNEDIRDYMSESLACYMAGAYRASVVLTFIALFDDIIDKLEINIKYEGYIKTQTEKIEQMKRLEEKQLPTDIDYKTISGLRLEAQEKLNKYRPLNIGQAGRISGVNPADVSVLLIWLSGRKHGEN